MTSGQTGLVTALGVGAANISAVLRGVTGSMALTVTPAVLTSIEITPSTPSLAKGTTQQLTATGIFSDHSNQNLTSQVGWSSGNTAVATVSSSAGSESLLAAGTGTATVSATLGSVTGSASVTVTPATLVSIGVTPPTSSIAKGLKQQFTATGVYTDNSTQDITAQVTWASFPAAVATIGNAVGSNGLASSVGIGSATITATLGSVTANASLTVTPAVLVSIGVTPASPGIAKV
ncbi:MAG: Ig-like domain-containing protein [Pseudomonadota bacterium]